MRNCIVTSAWAVLSLMGPRSREVEAYLPHWAPVPQPYDTVTLHLSHTATAGSDDVGMVHELGPRLDPPHLADAAGAPPPEPPVPGRGPQPVLPR